MLKNTVHEVLAWLGGGTETLGGDTQPRAWLPCCSSQCLKISTTPVSRLFDADFPVIVITS